MDAQTAVGVWIGKSLNSDEHYIGTAQGIRRCRSTYRRPEKKRWDEKIMQTMNGFPWQPRGIETTLPGTPAPGTPAPGTPGVGDGSKKRSVYIPLDRQIKHGSTPGCPGCSSTLENPKPHNAECKARFEALYPKRTETEAPQADVENTMEEGAGVGIFDDGPVIEDKQIARPRLKTRSGSAGGTASTHPPAGNTAVEAPADGTAAASSSAGGSAMEGLSQERFHQRDLLRQ